MSEDRFWLDEMPPEIKVVCAAGCIMTAVATPHDPAAPPMLATVMLLTNTMDEEWKLKLCQVLASVSERLGLSVDTIQQALELSSIGLKAQFKQWKERN